MRHKRTFAFYPYEWKQMQLLKEYYQMSVSDIIRKLVDREADRLGLNDKIIQEQEAERGKEVAS